MDDKTKHPSMNPINDTMLTRESWKIFQIMAEFVEGFERMARVKPSVSIFGSARTDPEHPFYKLTIDIARELSDAGFSVVSGGGQELWKRPIKAPMKANLRALG